MRREQLQSTAGAQSAFSLVEVILAVSIFALLITALAGTFVFGQESTRISGERVRAVFLAEEALEAVRNIRDDDFSNLTDGTHGLSISSSEWIFSGSSDVTDLFTRETTVSSIDADTKQITTNVSWQQNQQRSGLVSLVTYLTNWAKVVITIGDWSSPSIEGSLNISGNQNGWKVQVQGDYAYVVRTGGNPDFIVVDISNTASPSIAGSLVLSGGPANIAVSGNYAYVASGSNSQELQVIDISTPTAPIQVGSYNTPGNDNAEGVAVISDTVYLVTGNDGNGDEFFVIDASTPTSPTLVGSVDLGSSANEVVVIGNFAYVASSSNSQELQVVNVNVPSSPILDGSLDVSGNSNAISVAGFGSTVLVGRDDGSLHLINVNSPTAPTLLSTYDAQDNVRDISLGNSNNYAFLATDSNSAEFQVVDISDAGSPTQFGFLNLSADLGGVAYDETRDRVAAVGDSNSQEFVILQPQ